MSLLTVWTSRAAVAGMVALSLSLTSCKEYQAMQTQKEAAEERLHALRQEIMAVENKTRDLQRGLPAGTTPEAAARKLAARLIEDHKLVDAELTEAKQRLQMREAELAAMRKAVEAAGSPQQ